jgi:hypothetical protein
MQSVCLDGLLSGHASLFTPITRLWIHVRVAIVAIATCKNILGAFRMCRSRCLHRLFRGKPFERISDEAVLLRLLAAIAVAVLVFINARLHEFVDIAVAIVVDTITDLHGTRFDRTIGVVTVE